MSIIVKITRDGQPYVVKRLRNICSEIGEDATGMLTINNCKTPFFTIFPNSGTYYLKNDGLTEIRKGLSLQHGDYNFQFFPCSEKAEILSLIENPEKFSSSESTSVLSYQLGNFQKAFPLLRNIPLYAGADPKNEIYLDFPRVPAKAFCLFYDGKNIILNSLIEGGVYLDNTPARMDYQITDNSIISLRPSNLELKILFP